jgi:hypothetical protein
MLESYRTGSFIPKVVTYESYYNSVDEQTFGIDLEARARADRKRVPIIITSILTYLDHRKSFDFKSTKYHSLTWCNRLS